MPLAVHIDRESDAAIVKLLNELGENASEFLARLWREGVCSHDEPDYNRFCVAQEKCRTFSQSRGTKLIMEVGP